ncbi:enolase C-terminal domain-like protein [Roseicyclus mahoneyensis]|uniref:L-alanine-DL-glutamate epimerase-like enolase superfamily enzyme n=1 Tax=Roseicyclus mahoneyensis TaxID=164332 RepID=A0A316G5V8_9RHOB|nr:enolase C-terminal domain-like protein [Roseicyclus mahoneyensis]PWK56284.1 L-alanine-DL-glutamate epimerase-like enolase superfamily enzyme [Roseicyclus mahoneyensis]
MIQIDGPLRVAAAVHKAGAAPGDPAPYAGEDSFTFVRVQVTDADGVTGDGFTGRFCAAEVAHLLNGAVADALSGPGPMPDLSRKLNPRAMTGVVVSALSALDVALWDLAGKRAGKSVAALLGAARPSAPVDVTCGFPALDLDALVAACADEIAGGAHGVKVLVAAKGRSVAEDVARVAAVRAAIGDGAALIADANCGWDLDSAMAFARGAADLNLAFLEEPVRGNDRHALAALAAERIVPLGAGQMEQSAERFDLLAGAGVAVIQPNAVFAGGITAAVDAARAAEAAGCAVSPAGGWDLVNLHWMCGAMTMGAVELHRAQGRIARLLMGSPPEMAGGMLVASDAPGLGLSPDEEALAACRVI